MNFTIYFLWTGATGVSGVTLVAGITRVSGAAGVTLVTDILDAAGVLCATDIALAPGVRHVVGVVGVRDTMGGGSGPMVTPGRWIGGAVVEPVIPSESWVVSSIRVVSLRNSQAGVMVEISGLGG